MKKFAITYRSSVVTMMLEQLLELNVARRWLVLEQRSMFKNLKDRILSR